MTESQTLHKTPLVTVHEDLGASFTDFGGWWMPLRYGSDVAEHQAVRQAAGIFDLSHMGEIAVTGPDAAEFLDYALVGKLSALEPGRAKYSLLCNESGGVIDDLITYRLGADDFLVVPNAANTTAVLAALEQRVTTVAGHSFEVAVVDQTQTTALIAVQGPASEVIVSQVLAPECAQVLTGLRYYAITDTTMNTPEPVEVKVARTGYTGEDGFEIYVDTRGGEQRAQNLWKMLMDVGADHGMVPCGLAARDSLRLEAGMPLYGHELSENIDPYSAGLGAVVALKSKEFFVGRDALEAINRDGSDRVLVGLMHSSKRAARPGYVVFDHDQVVGEITSGAPSPTLGHAIALALVRADVAQVGRELDVDLRGKPTPFTVVELPFYRRER